MKKCSHGPNAGLIFGWWYGKKKGKENLVQGAVS